MLNALRVIELPGPFGDACGRLLESLGAQVTRARPATSAELLQLAAAADVLLESEGAARMRAWGLTHEWLQSHNPRLIHASLTAFGSHGPRASFRGGELVCAAMGGVLRMVGDPDRAPVKEALDACVFHAQACAAAAIMLAHYERAGSGAGQHIDVSVQEVAANRLTNALVLWQFDRRKLERSGGALRYGRAAVRCIWPLRDGHVFHSLMSGRFGAPANAALSAWMDEVGCSNPLREVDWLAYDRSALPAETRALWEQAIEAFFRTRSKAEITGEGARRGINAAVAQEPADVLVDPHLTARGFWTSSERAGRTLRVPGAFMHVRPAAAHGGTAAPAAPEPEHALSAVKILDLSWALVGSLTTKALADHGACVVKVESARRPCLTRVDVQVARSHAGDFDDKPWFAQLNTGKLSLQLDLKHPRAREVLDPLVAWADVIVENFSPGTLDKLGLGYDALRQLHPDVIMISASAFGQTGPLAKSWGVDGTSAALSGRTALTGWPDRAPVIPSAVPYADVLVPAFMVAAIGAALSERKRSGRGCYIDLSMYEISAQQMTRALSDVQLGLPAARSGNRDSDVWHQGVYPTRGEDRWIAISMFERADYARLRDALGATWPEAIEPDALDAALAERTRQQDGFQLMHTLQAAGIAAGVVQDIQDLLERDPQLRAQPAWQQLTHPVLGTFEHQTTPYHLERTPAQLRPSPKLGEHTRSVCIDILGLSEQHYEALNAAELFR